jgi:hypothetical protein
MDAVSWNAFAGAVPALAGHAEERLGTAPCFLSTLRRDGWPRLHPVGPFTLREGRLIVTMYPSSPKVRDLRRTPRYALHGPVEDTVGGGGEVLITGTAIEAEPTAADRAKGYVIFELLVGEVLATTYDADEDYRPVRRRWSAAADGARPG